MESITSLLSIALGAILVNNFVLSQFLGICPFLGVSKKVETALGMGMAVIFVMGVASAVRSRWMRRRSAVSCRRWSSDFWIRLSTACDTLLLESIRSSTMSAAVSRPGWLNRKLIIVASIGTRPYRLQTGLSMLSYSLIMRRILAKSALL